MKYLRFNSIPQITKYFIDITINMYVYQKLKSLGDKQ